MSFLNLMRNRLKPKEVNDALTDVQGRVLPVTTSASTGQMLGLTGEDKTPAWVDSPEELPSTSEATTGQILGLTGESKTPAWIDSPKELPSTSEASTGQVLGLIGENKTPGWISVNSGFNYSTSEVVTGNKWIDGSDIYCRVYSGTFDGSTQAVIPIGTSINQMIEISGIGKNSYTKQIRSSGSTCYVEGSNIYFSPASSDMYGSDYIVILFYTKPTPETKTRKRTTK